MYYFLKWPRESSATVVASVALNLGEPVVARPATGGWTTGRAYVGVQYHADKIAPRTQTVF